MGELDVAAALHRGMRIGRYQVLTQLTQGGMAELFLGYTTGPGGFRKYVVIKRILPDAKNNDQFVKMFLDEARVTAGFNHPNIAQVFELGQEESDLYLAMEFISGQNLNQVTAVCAKKRAVMPIGFSVAVVHDIAMALHYAHTFKDPTGIALPVIHRDVAQKNIMVTYDGAVKLLDFGIAKARGSLGRTHAGTVKGTTGYMSPEQVRGEALDGRSDVFGLGVVLFEMITGRRLFSAGTELEEMKMILSAPIARPSALVPVIPEALSDIVLRALAREKADRWASGKELARALMAQCQGLLYDPEARSMFMREHFDDQMSATAALLQSVNESTARQQLLAKAVNAIRGDGDLSNAQPMSKDELKTAKAKPRKKAAHVDTDEPPGSPPQAEPPGTGSMPSAAAPPSPNGGSRWSGTVPAALLIGMGLLGGALYKVAFTGGPPPPEQPFYDKPVPIPHAAEFDPPPAPVAKDEPAKKDEPKNRPPVVHTGTVTLITFPSSTVFRGKQQIGTTPLFNAPLPLGTHLLTLVGTDGVKHVLSVQVRDGKNAPLKVKLDELPAR